MAQPKRKSLDYKKRIGIRKTERLNAKGGFYYLESNNPRNPKKLRPINRNPVDINDPRRLILSAVVDYDLTRLTGHISKGVN